MLEQAWDARALPAVPWTLLPNAKWATTIRHHERGPLYFTPTLTHSSLCDSKINAGTGEGVETSKKTNGGANAKAADGRKLYKLENDTETFAHETVSSSLKKQIQSARLAKKMTQADLAKAINEKPQVINEYENGKAIPNPQVLSKMSRVLGVKLKKSG